MAFAAIHGGEGASEILAAPRFDFDEDQGLVVARHEIQLVAPEAHAPAQHPPAALPQKALGLGFAP
jgi:hypothetical protein